MRPPAEARLALRQDLKNNIAELLENDPNSVFILTGDLNSLNTNDLQTELGLDQIVNLPTHGANILDAFVTNSPDLFDLKIGQSLIITKHKALIVNDRSTKIQPVQYAARKSVQIRNYIPLTSNLLQ